MASAGKVTKLQDFLKMLYYEAFIVYLLDLYSLNLIKIYVMEEAQKRLSLQLLDDRISIYSLLFQTTEMANADLDKYNKALDRYYIFVTEVFTGMFITLLAIQELTT